MQASFKELLAEIKLGLVADAFMHSACFHQQLKKISIFESLEFHQSVFISPLRNSEVSLYLFILNRRQACLRNRKGLHSIFTVREHFNNICFVWRLIKLDIVWGIIWAFTTTLKLSAPESNIRAVCVYLINPVIEECSTFDKLDKADKSNVGLILKLLQMSISLLLLLHRGF